MQGFEGASVTCFAIELDDCKAMHESLGFSRHSRLVRNRRRTNVASIVVNL